MPRFKTVNYAQSTLLPISFDRQILSGSFEYTLRHLIDNELDLSIFDHRYQNDATGREAYDPSVLLKIVILAYSKGITSSRKMEALCRENILFMAISADTQPHFTTLADFVSSNHEQIAKLFQQVLLICGHAGLIGKDMFAIDGCKLPSNASKEWSGTRADLKKKQAKLERAVEYILTQHKQRDQREVQAGVIEQEQKQLETLRRAAQKIQRFLAQNDDKMGARGQAIQSNITDNDSAKMKTSHGVIQGYNGVASVDSKHQVVLAAEAFGQAQEHGLLEPMIERSQRALKAIGRSKAAIQRTKITADSGYHNDTALRFIEQHKLDAYIADTAFRSRDPRFADSARFDKRPKANKFTLQDFSYDLKTKTCICPAGKAMWLRNENALIKGKGFIQFQAYEKDCPTCLLRERCVRSETQTTPRQVNVPKHLLTNAPKRLVDVMREKIDSRVGRHIYSQRLGVVEPVFGHINTMMGFKRFSLRGKQKVNGQWQLITMVHNLLKIHRYGRS